MMPAASFGRLFKRNLVASAADCKRPGSTGTENLTLASGTCDWTSNRQDRQEFDELDRRWTQMRFLRFDCMSQRASAFIGAHLRFFLAVRGALMD
jgi:hypothetical protein